MNSQDGARELFQAALPSLSGEPKGRLPRSLYRYVWRVSGSQQARLCALTSLVFPLSMAPLELQRLIVNEAVERADLNLLIKLGVAYIVVLLVHGSLKYLRNLYQGRIAEGVIRLLRKRISRSLHARQDEIDDDKVDRGRADEGARVSMVASEAEQVGAFVGESLSFPLLQIGIFTSVAAYMFWVEPLVAGIAIGFFIPSLYIVPRLQRAINRHVEARTKLVRELGDHMVGRDNASGHDSRQAIEGFDDHIDAVYRTRIRIYLLKYLMKFLNNLLGQLGPLSVVFVGGWMVIEGQTQIGTIVAFLSGYERVTDPARELLAFYRRLSQMRMQYRLVFEALGQQRPQAQ